MSRRMGRFPTTFVPLNNFAPVFEGFRRPGAACREPSGLNGSREGREEDDLFLPLPLAFAEPGVEAAPGDMSCDCMVREGKKCLSIAPLGKL